MSWESWDRGIALHDKRSPNGMSEYPTNQIVELVQSLSPHKSRRNTSSDPAINPVDFDAVQHIQFIFLEGHVRVQSLCVCVCVCVVYRAEHPIGADYKNNIIS